MVSKKKAKNGIKLNRSLKTSSVGMEVNKNTGIDYERLQEKCEKQYQKNGFKMGQSLNNYVEYKNNCGQIHQSVGGTHGLKSSDDRILNVITILKGSRYQNSHREEV